MRGRRDRGRDYMLLQQLCPQSQNNDLRPGATTARTQLGAQPPMTQLKFTFAFTLLSSTHSRTARPTQPLTMSTPSCILVYVHMLQQCPYKVCPYTPRPCITYMRMISPVHALRVHMSSSTHSAPADFSRLCRCRNRSSYALVSCPLPPACCIITLVAEQACE